MQVLTAPVSEPYPNRMPRPVKKSHRLEVRLTDEELDLLTALEDLLGTPKAHVLMMGLRELAMSRGLLSRPTPRLPGGGSMTAEHRETYTAKSTDSSSSAAESTEGTQG